MKLKFYTFSQGGVSVGILLGDCWQCLLYCIDVSVFNILLLGFLVKHKPNSRYFSNKADCKGG